MVTSESDSVAVIFKERFAKAYERSPYNSHRALSLESGWSAARVNQILAGHFDHSESGPGFFGVVRSCAKMGITPDFLAGIDRWREHSPDTTLNALSLVKAVSTEMDAPSIEEMLRIYVRSGQRLEAFERYLEHCDVYDVPNRSTRTVTVRSVGGKSLSAMRMGAGSAELLQGAYDLAAPAFREKIYVAHDRAYRGGLTVEPDCIDERMENHPVHVKIDYSRLAMKLTDRDGQECIAIYCQIIPQ